MAVRLSVVTADAKWEGLKAKWAGCFAAVFTGSQPLKPEDAAGATLLVTITKDADGATGFDWDVPADATLRKPPADIWGGIGLAEGTAGWIRFFPAGDDPSIADATVERIDMAITRTGSSECVVSTTSVVVGGAFTVDSAEFVEPVV